MHVNAKLLGHIQTHSPLETHCFIWYLADIILFFQMFLRLKHIFPSMRPHVNFKEYKVQLFRHRLIKTLSRNGCYRAALPCNLTLTIWRNQFHFWREKHKVLGLLLRPPRRFQQPWHILSRFQWVSHLTWQTKPQAFTTHEKSERFLERGSVLLTRLMNVAAPDVSPHQVAAAAAAKSLSLA